jgi:hypothetical protein
MNPSFPFALHCSLAFFFLLVLSLLPQGCVLKKANATLPAPETLPLFSSEEIQEHLYALIQNVYQARSLEEPGPIYDCFAQSFSGEALEDQFFEHMRGMEELIRTNTMIGETTLRFIQFKKTAETLETLRVSTVWEAQGDIWHFIHKHTRKNQYEAEFVLGPRHRPLKEWRILQFRVHFEIRIEEQGNQK